MDAAAGTRGATLRGVAGIGVLLAALHLVFAAQTGLWRGRDLLDTDSYARMLRVLELWRGGAWYDGLLPWMNAPYGLPLHWTRPLDLLILLPAWPAMWLGAPAEAALYWSGALVCPVLHLACCLAAVWAARALWPEAWAWYAGALLLLDPNALGYAAFGRADHHTLILLCGVLGLGFSARAASGRMASALPAGVVFGVGVWVSPEALLFAVPALAGFGLLWLRGTVDAATAGCRVALGMALTIALALPLERAPAELLAVSQDRISVQHLALALAIAAVFAVVARLPPRLGIAPRVVAGAVAAGLAAGALLLAWPEMLRGSLAAAEGDMAARFLAGVGEMQPLRPLRPGGVAETIGFVGAAICAALALALPWRGAGPAWRGAAVVVALPLLACVLATFAARRFGNDLAAPAALAAAGFVPLAGMIAARRHPALLVPVRCLALLVALLLPLGGRLLTSAEAAPQSGCDGLAFAHWLRETRPADARAADRPLVMADNINLGPILAWHGRVRAVAGPYHSIGSAFADVQVTFGAAEDAAARAVLERRGVSQLLLCPDSPPPGGNWPADGLRARLLGGAVPAWLAEEPLPDRLRNAGFRLFALRG